MKSVGIGGVSVVIAAYNAEKHIERAIRSVMAQTSQPREVLIVDDGSRDATAEVVRRFGRGVKLIHQPNSGPGAARNRGAREASGEFLAFLDADDEFLPGMIEVLASALGRHSGVGAASAAYFYETCGVLQRRPAQGFVLGGAKQGIVPDYFDAARRSFMARVGATLVRKQSFDAIGGFREDIRFGEDIDLWTRLAGAQEWVFVDEPVMIYHHSVATSSTLRTPEHQKPVDFMLDEARLAGVVRPELRASYRRFRRDMLLRQARAALVQGASRQARMLLSAIQPAPPSLQWAATSALARFPAGAVVMLRAAGLLRRTLPTRVRQLREAVVGRPGASARQLREREKNRGGLAEKDPEGGHP